MQHFCSNLPRPTAEPFHALATFVFAFNGLVIPQLVQSKVCSNMYNSTVCASLGKHQHSSFQNTVQVKAAHWMSVLPLTYLVPGLVTIFIIGPLTDVIGKRTVMVVPPLLYMIQSICFVILSSISRPFSPGYFLIPASFAGLFGDNAGVILLSFSYMADITGRKERTVRLSILEAAYFTGTLGAGLVSGILVTKNNFAVGFIATAVISGINLAYVLFLLPSEDSFRLEIEPLESEPLETEPQTDEDFDYGSLANNDGTAGYTSKDTSKNTPHRKGWRVPLATIAQELHPKVCFLKLKSILCREKKGNRIIALLTLLGIALITNMGQFYMGILFLKHSPFNMNAAKIGYLAAAQFTFGVLGVLTIPYFGQRYLKMGDIHLVILGFSFQIVFFMILGFSVSLLMLFLTQILAVGIPIHMPVLRSMITKLVDDDQHGTVLTIVEAIDITSSLITSFTSNMIYAATVKTFSGFAVCLLSIYACFGLIGAIIYRTVVKKDKTGDLHALKDSVVKPLIQEARH